ncbi:MAG: glycyl-radical enzyme activating protein, partial [Gemmatimonadota bacterium]
RRVTGVPLEPILENLGRLLSGGARVRIRVPMVPGVTTDASIERTAALLIGLPPVEGVDLLPYHPSARDKHRRFRIPWRLPDADPIPADRVEGWRARLADRGLPVGIGG